MSTPFLSDSVDTRVAFPPSLECFSPTFMFTLLHLRIVCGLIRVGIINDWDCNYIILLIFELCDFVSQVILQGDIKVM